MTRFAQSFSWCVKRAAISFAVLALLGAPALRAQQIPPSAYQEMRWRSIGPYRGGRTRALSGVASQPNVFYIGGVDSGVWKSDDFGETWTPIFDGQDTGSIGAIAVAPSDPNIVYVGSGEGLPRPDLSVGDGMYKSTDAGKTWTHLGLHDGQQICNIVIDTNNPNRLFVSVLGHPYGPNPERGIYRSTDGGQSLQKVLGRDDNTGGNDVEMDPANPNVLYASLWSQRQGPWEDGNSYAGPGGLFKSTDGGDNWKPLTNGLPEGVQQVDIAIAPSNPSRIYASVAFARGVQIFRSDDSGESWTRATTDTRPAARIGGGDLPVLRVDPKDPDVVYSTSTVTWRSMDGGKTWTGIRGAPGGDDYQNIWINPNHPDIILLVSDQGALVSENRGRTWTSWYNQPTAQLYHVVADNGFPYRVCAGQQDSGSVCIASRGNDGEITFRDWHPVGVIEYGYAVPDPKNPNIIYGAGRNDVTKYHWDTGQVEKITPIALGGDFRTDRTQPLIFSPVNNTTIFFAANVLFKTEDGGHSWQQISPDLTREHPGLPESVGDMAKNTPGADAHRGVIYAVAPSFHEIGTIWIGTDDGNFQMTRDGGKTWNNLTPAELKPWSKVTQMTASHFDEQSAYASVSRFRVDDLHPYIYRTHDGGKSWKLIVNGIAEGAAVDSVREDPVRKGLLFAATENTVWVSWDDGDDWQSLQMNLPHTANRDLWIHDSCSGAAPAAAPAGGAAAHSAPGSGACSRDLIDATHGRGFWILDDITPLEQMNAQSATAAAHLFKPEIAFRYRRSTNTDTPLPPETPAGQNPPDGAIINYSLGSSASGAVTLEILDAGGKLVRRFSSDDKPEIDPTELERTLGVPTYWVRMPQTISTAPGMHRFIWDLHYAPLEGVRRDYPISAVPHDTPPLPRGPRAAPGAYTVKLTVNGQSQSQQLVVRIDPRVKTPQADLAEQTSLELHIADSIHRGAQAIAAIRSLRDELAKLSSNSAVSADAAALDKKAEALMGAQGGGRGGRGGAAAGAAPTFGSVDGGYSAAYGLIDSADSKPTAPQTEAVHKLDGQAAKLEADWAHLKTVDLAALNTQLQKAGMPPITTK